MSKIATSATLVVAALVLCAALVHCFDSGPGNTSFTHPYTGYNGVHDVGDPSTDGNSTSGNPNTDLIAGDTAGAGTATVTGTIRQVGFTPAVALFDDLGSDPNSPLQLVVVLSDNSNFCTAAATNHNMLASSNYALIQFLAIDANSNMASLSVGNYNVVVSTTLSGQPSTGNYAAFDFFALDNQCLQSLSDNYYQALDGNFTLTAFSNDANAPTISGSMNLVVGRQSDKLSGSFTAAPCPGLYDSLFNDPNATATGFGCQ